MSGVRLNRRLVLESPVRTPDGAGGYDETWLELGTLWAAITPRAGRMARGPLDEVSRGGFRIVVRAAPVGHSGRPEPGQRFRMDTRLFRIEAVTEEEPAGLYLVCQCEEERAA